MKNNASINCTDRIYITAIHGRETIVCSNFSGVGSLNDIYRYVVDSAQGRKGVVTLRLRNSTQGWVQQHTLVLNPGAARSGGKMSGHSRVDDYPSLFGPNVI